MKLPNTIISLILNKNDEKEWEKLYFLFQDEIEWKINHNKIMNTNISKFIKSIKLIIYDKIQLKDIKKEYILNKNDCISNIINYEYKNYGFNNCELIIDTEFEKNLSLKFNFYYSFKKLQFTNKKRINFNKGYYFNIIIDIEFKEKKLKSIKYKIERNHRSIIERNHRSIIKNPLLYRYGFYLDQEQKDLIDKYDIIYDIYEEKYDCEDKGDLYLVYKRLYNGEYEMKILCRIYYKKKIEIIKKFTKIINGKVCCAKYLYDDNIGELNKSERLWFDGYGDFLYHDSYYNNNYLCYDVIEEMINDYINKNFN